MLQAHSLSNSSLNIRYQNFLTDDEHSSLEKKDHTPYQTKEKTTHKALETFAKSPRNKLRERNTLYYPRSTHENQKLSKTFQDVYANDLVYQKRYLKELGPMHNYIEDLNDSDADYDDLQIMREYSTALFRLQKIYGNSVLKNGQALKNYVRPYSVELKEKIDRILKTKEIAAFVMLEKFVAKKKGQKIRNCMVTTRQMFSLLSGRLLGVNLEELHDVSKALARQINEIMEDPYKYRGKNLQLKANAKKYSFYSFENDATEKLSLNFPFWLELSEDAKKLKLFIIPPGEKLLNEGQYKKVCKAQLFLIDLRARKKITTQSETAVTDSVANAIIKPKMVQSFIFEREGTYSPMVLQEAQDADCVRYIEKGIALQKKMQDLNPRLQLPDLTKKPAERVKDTKPFCDNPVYYQKWYNFDLLQMLTSNDTIPLDISRNPKLLQLDFSDILDIFIDVGTSLAELHHIGIVHRDIKTSNIFIEALSTKDKVVKGYPADFDLTQKIGTSRAPGPKGRRISHWDRLANLGVVTPFTDVYGLTISLAEAFIPSFKQTSPKTLLNDQTCAEYLWSIIDKALKDNLKDTPLAQKVMGESPSAALTEKVISHLKISADKAVGPIQIEYQNIYAEICAVKKIIALVAEVIRNDNQLSSNFVVNSDDSFTSICFRDPKNKSPEKQLQTYKQKYSDQDSKSSAVIFLKRVKGLEAEERWKHPLYHALKNPMELTNQEVIDHCLNTEIEMIKIPVISLLNIRKQEALCGIIDANERRKAFKWLLLKTTQDPKVDKHVKKDCHAVLDQIFIIEQAVNFVLMLRDEFNEILPEILKTTMTMKAFVDELKKIQHSYVHIEESEEKS